MAGFDDFGEVGAVDVGVDLGGGDVGVSEEFLDDAEVGAAGEEVGGEGVAEGVGVDVAEAGAFGGTFDDLPDDDAGDGQAGAGEEETGVVRLSANEDGAEIFDVGFEGAGGGGADGDDAFLVAFAHDFDATDVEVEPIEVHVGDFAGAQAGGVHEFEHGDVTEIEIVIRVGSRE